MPNRPRRPCKQPGCPALVVSGYCPLHAHLIGTEIKARFKALEARRPEHHAFYHTYRWTLVSRLHRAREPLCRRCKQEGRVVCGELTHHNPPLEDLLRNGKDPYNEQYLETLCNDHHQAELSAKRSLNNAKKHN
jgi:5-methylcytosine-specific restriction protein A